MAFEIAPATRTALKDERSGVNVKFTIYDQEKGPLNGYLTVNTFENGYPAEIFIDMGKEGHETHGWADMWALSLSLMFQHGIPHELIYQKFEHQDFTPNGMSNRPEAMFCKSVVDLIIKYLKVNFPPTKVGDQDEYDTIINMGG